VSEQGLESLERHHWPYFLPDGKHFLYFTWEVPSSVQRKNGIYVASLEDSTPKLILSDITGNVQYAGGYLLYVRDRTVMAQAVRHGKSANDRSGDPANATGSR